MTRKFNTVLLLLLLGACAQHPQKTPQVAITVADEFLRLEAVASELAVDEVKKRHVKSLQVIKNHPRFYALYKQSKALYHANDGCLHNLSRGGAYALVCSVLLLNMKRHNKLLAGASNNDQSADLRALTYTYFWHQLGQTHSLLGDRT